MLHAASIWNLKPEYIPKPDERTVPQSHYCLDEAGGPAALAGLDKTHTRRGSTHNGLWIWNLLSFVKR